MCKKDYSFLKSENACDLSKLKEMVLLFEQRQKQIGILEDQLKEEKKQLEKLSSEYIPEFLKAAGLSETKIADGRKIKITEDIHCALPKDIFKREVCINFIRTYDNKIIKKAFALYAETTEIEDILNKTAFTVYTGADYEKKTLSELLQVAGVQLKKEESIHPQTLAAFFREKLGLKENTLKTLDLAEIPKFFNVFIRKKTKITK